MGAAIVEHGSPAGGGRRDAQDRAPGMRKAVAAHLGEPLLTRRHRAPTFTARMGQVASGVESASSEIVS